MTHLFAGAEEREEVDNGAMLRRVVALQDSLLAQGVDGINDWLETAERPQTRVFSVLSHDSAQKRLKISA